jgi:hypothetical protein
MIAVGHQTSFSGASQGQLMFYDSPWNHTVVVVACCSCYGFENIVWRAVHMERTSIFPRASVMYAVLQPYRKGVQVRWIGMMDHHLEGISA